MKKLIACALLILTTTVNAENVEVEFKGRLTVTPVGGILGKQSGDYFTGLLSYNTNSPTIISTNNSLQTGFWSQQYNLSDTGNISFNITPTKTVSTNNVKAIVNDGPTFPFVEKDNIIFTQYNDENSIYNIYTQGEVESVYLSFNQLVDQNPFNSAELPNNINSNIFNFSGGNVSFYDSAKPSEGRFYVKYHYSSGFNFYTTLTCYSCEPPLFNLVPYSTISFADEGDVGFDANNQYYVDYQNWLSSGNNVINYYTMNFTITESSSKVLGVSPVPEPRSFSLLLIGLLFITYRIRDEKIKMFSRA